MRNRSAAPFCEFLISLATLSVAALTLFGCTQATGGSGHDAPPTPMIIITSLSQTSGAVGTPVTISGTNFGATQGSSTVAFNGTAATATSWSATSIAVTVPSGATTGNVIVTVGGQTSNGVSFTVSVPSPTITSLSQTSGAVGTPVTITGTNFGATQGSSTVAFNGTAATATSWSATSIAVTVPSGATTGNVIVTVGGQASNGVSFTVSVPLPTITSLNQTSGAVGTPVTITGTNFGATQGTSTVAFNGTAATATSWSATSITVTVPSGATTGNVIVTVGGQTSNGVSFTVTVPLPTITSLSQTSGAVGTPVTISGTNFGATQGSSTITFNGIVATATSWGATSIAVTVPSGATTGNVVATVGGQASNGVSFTVTASGSNTVAISPERAGLTVTQTLSVTPTTNDSAGVTWSATGTSCSQNSCGSFSQSTSLSGVSVTYTAPAIAGIYTITATSHTDLTVSASITVGVTDLAGVYTWHNNPNRDGSNTQEYALTPELVNKSTFGKLFTCSIDAAAYAQPLWVANVSIGGGKHNVVYVATQKDTIYAFDADANPCQTLATRSLLGANETWLSNTDVGVDDIGPLIGIIGTPVIDPATSTIYLVTKSKATSGTSFIQRLHALSLSDLSEKTNSPVQIAEGGSGSFALIQNQRAGLVLSGSSVYVTWASYGDIGAYHGYIYQFDKSSLNQTATFNDTPNGHAGGIWMSGAAPAVDSSGNLFCITGNGSFDASQSNYGDSFLKLTSSLSVADYFTPTDEATDAANDLDFGAGGAAILVDSGPAVHLAVGGGKDAVLYVLNRDKMGHLGDSNAAQKISVGSGIFSTAAFWQNTLYLAVPVTLRAYPLTTSTPPFGPISSQTGGSFGWPGSTPSISSLGASNGIIWAFSSSAVLHAYDATNLATELWNSNMVAADQAGGYVKFTVPTVANGKVYIGNSNQVTVYGLKPN
jgi:hypothetical protein